MRSDGNSGRGKATGSDGRAGWAAPFARRVAASLQSCRVLAYWTH